MLFYGLIIQGLRHSLKVILSEILITYSYLEERKTKSLENP